MTSLHGILNFKYQILPDWWLNLYPITYYFVGCYLNEYNINISKKRNIIYILITLLASTIFNIIISNNSSFVWGIHNDNASIFNLLLAMLVFELLKKVNLTNLKQTTQKILITISNLSLGIYLTSSIVDNFFNENIFTNSVGCNFKTYIKIVPLVFLTSTLLAIVLNFVYKKIDKYIIKRIFAK